MAVVVAVGSSVEVAAVVRAYDEIGPFVDALPSGASSARFRSDVVEPSQASDAYWGVVASNSLPFADTVDVVLPS